MKKIIAILLGLYAGHIFGESTNERLLDLEAQVHTLSKDLSATKSLAEQERPSAFNPSISVIGDIIAQFGHNLAEAASKDHGFSPGVFVRELEFEFRGDIDPWADALVALALHHHGGHTDIHIEEAYARLKQWPGLNYAPLGIEARIGKFKTAIGRMNRIHMHNVPQITYPLTLRTFLGEEGYAGTGLSLKGSHSFTKKSALIIMVEGVMGSRVRLQDKPAKEIPNGIVNLWWHQDLSSGHFLDLGASALLGRKGAKDSGLFTLYGADVHYSYIPAGYGQDPIFLAGSEFFAANPKKNSSWALGNFTWAQARLVGSSFVGLRYDVAPQDNLNGFQHAVGAYLGFYTSEFLRFRFGYEHVMPKLNSIEGDHRYMLSMNFVLGAHPVEPYYANR